MKIPSSISCSRVLGLRGGFVARLVQRAPPLGQPHTRGAREASFVPYDVAVAEIDLDGSAPLKTLQPRSHLSLEEPDEQAGRRRRQKPDVNSPSRNLDLFDDAHVDDADR